MSYVNILKVGADNMMWMKGLDFYRDELELMNKRLVQISAKNTSIDVAKGIEHFQNQFMIQQKNISDLKHKVKNFGKNLSGEAEQHTGHVDEKYINEATELKDRYEREELIMNSLRKEFNEYLSKWM